MPEGGVQASKLIREILRCSIKERQRNHRWEVDEKRVIITFNRHRPSAVSSALCVRTWGDSGDK